MKTELHQNEAVVSRLALPARGAFLGAFLCEGLPTEQAFRKFERLASQPPSLVMWYHAFCLGFEFPEAVCDQLHRLRATPFIRWEPWSWMGKDDQSFALHRIAEGDFDKQIAHWAIGARQFGRPILQSFGHEMNTPFDKRWYPWAGLPWDYVAASRRMVTIFRDVGATNVEWVFSPNEWESSIIAEFYPGREYVDWFGIDGFNFGDSEKWSSWRTFDQVFRAPYERLCHLDPEVPMMIAEFACADKGGDKGEWIGDALRRLQAVYPRIRAVVWFNIAKEADWRLSSSAQVEKAFQEAVRASNGYYL